jgi:hypothetical protein
MPSLPPRHQVPDREWRKPNPYAKPKARGRDTRDRSDDVRVKQQWKKLRRHILCRNPLCADPFGYHAKQGEVKVADELPHILPLRFCVDDKAHLACDEDNFSLVSCGSKPLPV